MLYHLRRLSSVTSNEASARAKLTRRYTLVGQTLNRTTSFSAPSPNINLHTSTTQHDIQRTLGTTNPSAPHLQMPSSPQLAPTLPCSCRCHSSNPSAPTQRSQPSPLAPKRLHDRHCTSTYSPMLLFRTALSPTSLTPRHTAPWLLSRRRCTTIVIEQSACP